jgi:hypothetical protein
MLKGPAYESVDRREACPVFITGNPAPAERDFTSFGLR